MAFKIVGVGVLVVFGQEYSTGIGVVVVTVAHLGHVFFKQQQQYPRGHVPQEQKHPKRNGGANSTGVFTGGQTIPKARGHRTVVDTVVLANHDAGLQHPGTHEQTTGRQHAVIRRGHAFEQRVGPKHKQPNRMKKGPYQGEACAVVTFSRNQTGGHYGGDEEWKNGHA